MTAMALWSQGAKAEPAPLDVYGGLSGIEDMSISASGDGLAVVGQIADQRRLIIFGPDLMPRTNAPIDEAKLRYIRWIGNDVVNLVTSSTEPLGFGFTTDKVELRRAILVHADGSKVDLVFRNRPQIAKAIFGDYGTRLVDGKWTAFFGGIELKKGSDGGYYFDHGRPALFGVDVASNIPKRAAPSVGESFWRDWLVDGDGIVAARLDVNKSTGTWKVINNGGLTLATGVDQTGDVALISFGKDGSGVVYSIEDTQSGETRWFEVPLAGGASQEILADESIERVYIDPMNGRMLGYLERSETPKPVLFDPAQQSVVRKIFQAFPKLSMDIVEWTPDFSHFLVHTSGNGDSGTWFKVDVAKRKADPVGYDYPAIPSDQVGPVSTIAYKASDGLDLDGILTLPPGRAAKNLPVIIFPHGGPHSYDRAAFDWWAQAFASRGYAVFQPNFRGSTHRGDAFRRAGYGEWGRKMQSDLSDGLAHLAKQGTVDPRRACIVGASYGGYAALAGVTLQQGLYRCAVAVAPVSDLRDMYNTDNRESGQDKMVKRSLLESLGDPARFGAVSPRRSAGKADAPILLIHGKDDTVVPFRQSTAMADALRDAGKPYELITLKAEDHWLSRAETRKQMLEATMRFVQQHNPAD